MIPLVLLSAILAPESGWTFVDAASRDGRSTVTFRTVELGDTPGRPLHADDRPAPGARFAIVPLGPGGLRLGLVWHVASRMVWLDADGDGRYASAERYQLGAGPLEVSVAIAFDDQKPVRRTLLIRKRGDGLAYAVRGYTLGRVMLGGKTVAAMLEDGDADGCFDGAGADRVWLDLDGDGTFDPFTEQFPLGTVITHAGTGLLARPSRDGLGLVLRERPAELGGLVVQVDRLPGAQVAELAAHYESQWGELVVVKETDRAVPMPAGKYRLAAVDLRLTDTEGQLWHYAFYSGDRSFEIEVVKGRETRQVLLGALKVIVSLNADGTVPPGGSVQVQPDVMAGKLQLTKCEVGPRQVAHGREVSAELRLTEPGSMVLDRASAGFS